MEVGFSRVETHCLLRFWVNGWGRDYFGTKNTWMRICIPAEDPNLGLSAGNDSG